MSLLEMLSDKAVWEVFYEYKTSLACPKDFCAELRSFIDSKAYEPVCDSIKAGEPFPLPRRAVINKQSSQKSRIVYMYPRAENTVLKLLTFLMLRRYDGIFCDNLYSFRPGRTAKLAVKRMVRCSSAGRMYAYKVDISNYFNSIPIDKLLPMLEKALSDDPKLFAFLKALLTEPNVISGGKLLQEQKGIMAGTPLSAFYADLYLCDLDSLFSEAGPCYARYSDDIMILAESREECEEKARLIRRHLADKGLTVNPDKEEFFTPDEGWTFLGFKYRQGSIDISPQTVTKLKHKMRRKARALRRWTVRNYIPPEKAAAAFIRIFKRKLIECPADNELSWSRWFFSLITTAESLRIIDRYAVDCIRYIISGKRSKARFRVTYPELKSLGYVCLVNAYYSYRKQQNDTT